MVAKSYQQMEQTCEPYVSNGRQYVRVRTPSGSERVVRWYTEAEYTKLYGEAVPPKTPKRPLKEVLGFDNGYITIFKGDTYAHIDWFRDSICRYAKYWGWYVVSTEDVPSDIPTGLTTVKLPWDRVAANDNTLLDEATISEVVADLVYEEGTSEYIGSIGERIELDLTVVKAIELDWGILHEFVDDANNVFIWSTAAKNLAVGKTYHIRSTVKGHKEYRKTKQTILTRCFVS